MTQPHPQKKCPKSDSTGCSHFLNEHTARGGCMHQEASGRVCGCTYTTGLGQGASPFAEVPKFAAPPPDAEAILAPLIQKENTSMTAQLLNIAGVAAELSVTPQAASAWHRGPDKTPAPSFKANTGLELWTVEDVELWHKWVEAREAKKAAPAKKAEPAPTTDAYDLPVDEPSAEPAPEAESGLSEFSSVETSDDVLAVSRPRGKKTA